MEHEHGQLQPDDPRRPLMDALKQRTIERLQGLDGVPETNTDLIDWAREQGLDDDAIVSAVDLVNGQMDMPSSKFSTDVDSAAIALNSQSFGQQRHRNN